MDESIKVLFPLTLLKPSVELLDPSNTETIWEYYLLENLSCGLIRDSKFSATEYEGCIAERFYQEDEHTWVFHIRQLRWSDGSEVTNQEIQNWLDSLVNSSQRHIKFLKLAEKITYDKDSRVVKMRFPFAMDKTILHELSLADASLVPNFREMGWLKTVGPYYVEKWDFDHNILILRANIYSPFYSKLMPQKATLFRLINKEDRNELFKSINVDIAPLVAPASPKVTAQVLPQAPQIFTSHPISIVYFVFNSKNPDAKNFANRKMFASIIGGIRSQISGLFRNHLPANAETQMIPVGFRGRLSEFDLGFELPEKHAKKISIKFPSVFRDFDGLMSELEKSFSERGVKTEFEFSDAPEFSDHQFARATVFLGNQLDASGTWAFLSGPPNGPLSPWIAEYKAAYDQVFHSNDLSNRQKKLDNLHKEILEKALAVPLMIGSQRYILSSRLDASRWNQFDSRLRLYELRWK